MGDLEGIGPEGLFGRIAVARRYVGPEQVRLSLEIQRELAQMGIARPIGQIMLEQGYLTYTDLQEILAEQRYDEVHDEDSLFGRIAVRNGFLTEGQLEQTLLYQDAQMQAGREVDRLGDVLVARGILTDEDRQAIVRVQERLERRRVSKGEGAGEGIAEVAGDGQGRGGTEAVGASLRLEGDGDDERLEDLRLIDETPAPAPSPFADAPPPSPRPVPPSSRLRPIARALGTRWGILVSVGFLVLLMLVGRAVVASVRRSEVLSDIRAAGEAFARFRGEADRYLHGEDPEAARSLLVRAIASGEKHDRLVRQEGLDVTLIGERVEEARDRLADLDAPWHPPPR